MYLCGRGLITAFVILKGDRASVSWIPPSALELNWYFAASAKGWTNNDRGFEWLTKVFNPHTREKAQGRTRLLICDGHDSHISAKFVAHCIENNICLFLLLPYSSHLLQPLDVGVFSSLKTAGFSGFGSANSSWSYAFRKGGVGGKLY